MFHLYADDTKVYLGFKRKDSLEQCITRLDACVHEIQYKLNPEKVEFMLIGTRQQLAKTGQVSLEINGESIHPVSTVQSRVYVQVAKLCSSACLMLQTICTMRR